MAEPFADDERKTLNALLEEVRPGVFVFCYRLVGSVEDAEDLTQEALLKASQGYAGFEHRSSFRTWAYRIAANTCYNFLRSARTRRERVVPDPLATTDEFLHAVDPSGDAEDVRESLEFSFLCVLQELSPLQRLVVVLRDVLGWSVKDTVRALGGSEPALKNIHSRARKRLLGLRPARATLPPSHPEAQRFMERFAEAHVGGDVSACLRFFDDGSEVYAFPTRRYVGRQALGEFYASMMAAPPTLFVGVKLNGSLGAACYHPTQEGALRRTGVVIVELEKAPKGAPVPRVARVFWAMQPEHHRRVPLPAEMPATTSREAAALL
jgi:RNA polymerase sigma-70 factor (ECF subfamily)